ncbi:hypothetical protein [Desulfosediminicola flagellatus]|uniref:hypothetical protein n=1 Tax=Desulfosediminicola flagellatus TaxID=2569541 RepID=UPI0010AD22BA|nr:hypothetical protein [Desulfosediminicola flagellatus]
MLIQSWSVALSISSIAILFLGFVALFAGIGILRYWDHGADTVRQIGLESRTWLTSALMEYGLFFQLLSLLLLIMAADGFSSLLVGAMCATGAFLANEYGTYTLASKIVLSFFCGYWVLLHRLDLCSEYYPLVRVKHLVLFVLVPFLGMDLFFQSMYLYLLEPDVITSCCGVIFRPSDGDGYNYLDPFSTPVLLSFHYGIALLLLGLGILIKSGLRRNLDCNSWLMGLYSAVWALFFIVALWTITVVFSSYIYAMPFHRCPFDILQAEFNYVGFPIYFLLMTSVFLGTGCGVAQTVRRYQGLAKPVVTFQQTAISACQFLLILFLLITAYAPVRYMLAGGEF